MTDKSIIGEASCQYFIKPLSVNEAWQGRRYKTKAYETYEKLLLYSLPMLKIPAAPFEVHYIFGMSNGAADIDNPIKPLQDIIQKKYGINDKDIYKIIVLKSKVRKGNEYISFRIKTFNG